jgi:hypothetical protein
MASPRAHDVASQKGFRKGYSMMTVRRLLATGLASATLLGIGSGAAVASAAVPHPSHSKCVPAGQPGPGTPCTVRPKPTHVPKPKPTHVPKPKPPKTITPHQSHHKTATPTPLPGH